MSYEQLWGVVTVWLLAQVRWRWWGRVGYAMWWAVLCSASVIALYPALGERVVGVALTWSVVVVLMRSAAAKGLSFLAWCDHIRYEDPAEIAAKLQVRYGVHLRALDTLDLAMGIVVMVTLIGPYGK